MWGTRIVLILGMWGTHTLSRAMASTHAIPGFRQGSADSDVQGFLSAVDFGLVQRRIVTGTGMDG
jgi:hypothetical protein